MTEILKPRTHGEWQMTILRWVFYLSLLWAISYSLVIAKSAGWIL